MFYRLLGKICFYFWIVPFVATITKSVIKTAVAKEVDRELEEFIKRNKMPERPRPNRTRPSQRV